MSLLRATGQHIRFNTASVTMIVGIALVVFGGPLAPLGVLGVVVAMSLLCFTIRCPACKCRWVLHFLGVSGAGNRMTKLRQMTACPRCGYSGDTSEAN